MEPIYVVIVGVSACLLVGVLIIAIVKHRQQVNFETQANLFYGCWGFRLPYNSRFASDYNRGRPTPAMTDFPEFAESNRRSYCKQFGNRNPGEVFLAIWHNRDWTQVPECKELKPDEGL